LPVTHSLFTTQYFSVDQGVTEGLLLADNGQWMPLIYLPLEFAGEQAICGEVFREDV